MISPFSLLGHFLMSSRQMSSFDDVTTTFVSSSHENSVMGHKRPNFKQPRKHDDFVNHDNFFRKSNQKNKEISFREKHFWGLVAL